MRRLGATLLLLACTGCVGSADLSDALRWDTPAIPRPAPPRQITPEQVTSQNAHKLSQALLDELDRETNQGLTTPRK